MRREDTATVLVPEVCCICLADREPVLWVWGTTRFPKDCNNKPPMLGRQGLIAQRLLREILGCIGSKRLPIFLWLLLLLCFMSDPQCWR